MIELATIHCPVTGRTHNLAFVEDVGEYLVWTDPSEADLDAGRANTAKFYFETLDRAWEAVGTRLSYDLIEAERTGTLSQRLT